VFLVKTTDSVCNQALLAAIEITHCSDVQNLAVDCRNKGRNTTLELVCSRVRESSPEYIQVETKPNYSANPKVTVTDEVTTCEQTTPTPPLAHKSCN
jgi:hypothetical protein